MTQPEEGDPLAASYGDSPLIASEQRSGRTWTPVHALTPDLKDQKVRLATKKLMRDASYQVS